MHPRFVDDRAEEIRTLVTSAAPRGGTEQPRDGRRDHVGGVVGTDQSRREAHEIVGVLRVQLGVREPAHDRTMPPPGLGGDTSVRKIATREVGASPR